MQVIEYNNIFQITIPFNYQKDRKMEDVKNLPSRKWNYIKKVWEVPTSYRSEVENLINKWKAEYISIGNVTPEQIGTIAPLPDLEYDLPINAELRHYQKQGIARGIELRRLLNGDEPGLGKTIQSIATIVGIEQVHGNAFPVLCVVPASLKMNWQREWEKFSDKKVMILDDKVKNTWHRYYEMGMADVFIVNYESLKKFFVKHYPAKSKLKTAADIIMDPRIDFFKSVIVDESHKCKSTQTQQSKLTLRVAHGKENVILLSGTPVVNKPIDLFPQLAIMGRMKEFGGKKGFLNRYCEGGRGAANLKELNFLLNKHCYFRREKKDVLEDLPEKERQTILCDITTKELYDKAKNDFVKFLQDKGCDDAEIRKKLRGEIMVKMGELKRISARGKLNEVFDFVDEIVDAGEKIILFCNLHEIVDALQNRYPKAVSVTGRCTMEEKQRAVDSFQTNPNTQIFIGNIKAAGVGLTLTASSRVAFIEYPWTYADCVQCEDRAHRFGQKNNVMCTYFLGQNTIDEDLYKMIQEKRNVANTISGATDQMEMSFVDNVITLFNKK